LQHEKVQANNEARRGGTLFGPRRRMRHWLVASIAALAEFNAEPRVMLLALYILIYWRWRRAARRAHAFADTMRTRPLLATSEFRLTL